MSASTSAMATQTAAPARQAARSAIAPIPSAARGRAAAATRAPMTRQLRGLTARAVAARRRLRSLIRPSLLSLERAAVGQVSRLGLQPRGAVVAAPSIQSRLEGFGLEATPTPYFWSEEDFVDLDAPEDDEELDGEDEQ